MLDAALWGLIQGLTEFLPISSSGHLVLVPAVLGRAEPDLATSAVLHLGTLVAVLAYFRVEVGEVVRFTRQGRRLFLVLLIGTVPAAVLGLAFKGPLDRFQQHEAAVAVALALGGVALVAASRLPTGRLAIDDVTKRGAFIIGAGQALALIPGVSRSGMTIGAGIGQHLEAYEAARFSFLLGIPAIAAAGTLELIDLARSSVGVPGNVWLGVVVAAASGYLAIAVLLRIIRSLGLAPFGVYCIVAGVVAFFIV